MILTASTTFRIFFSHSGENFEIDFDNNTEKRFSDYRTNIYKTEDLEDDVATGCFSYENYSYKNCTDSIVYGYYFQQIGCVPPWFTYNIDIVCNRTFDEDQWFEHTN